MTKFTKLLLFSLLTLLCFSYVDDVKRELDFSSEKDVKKSVKHLKDSTNLFTAIGKDFEREFSSSCMRTVTGSTLTRSNTYRYLDLGIAIIYIKSTSGVPSDDFSEFEVISESEWMRIEINSNSKVPVYGLVTNESVFEEIIKLEPKGSWAHLREREGNKNYFTYSTKYVDFNSNYLSESLIDSLNLDEENPELLNDFFREKVINNFTIRENDSFYLRVLK